MNEESLRDIALELLELVGRLNAQSIYSDEYETDPDEEIRQLNEYIAEFRKRIDNAK
jgi:hypothetical protein